MSKTIDHPTSLLEAVRYFSDPDVCHEYMVRVRWTDQRLSCPKCGSEEIGQIASRRMFQCKDCRKQFSTKVGTIFEDSPLGLDKWFVAVWCIANAKNGISSCELARALGVTQKTAWHMLHRIRLAMKTKSFRKIRGEVESDESFIGGKAKNMHEPQGLDGRRHRRQGGGHTPNSRAAALRFSHLGPLCSLAPLVIGDLGMKLRFRHLSQSVEQILELVQSSDRFW
jgi:transposase-like protein